jgi:hypothetical protein
MPDYTNLEDLKPNYPNDWMHTGWAGMLEGQRMVNYQKDRDLHEYLNELNKQEATQKTKEFLTSAPTRQAEQLLAQQKAESASQQLPGQTGLAMEQTAANRQLLPGQTALTQQENAQKLSLLKQQGVMEQLHAVTPYQGMYDAIDADKDMTPEQKESKKQQLDESVKDHLTSLFPDKHPVDKLDTPDKIRDFVKHSSVITTMDAEQQKKIAFAHAQRLDPALAKAQSQIQIEQIRQQHKDAQNAALIQSRIQIQDMKDKNPTGMAGVLTKQIDDVASTLMASNPTLDAPAARAIAGQQVLTMAHTTLTKDITENKAFAQFVTQWTNSHQGLKDLIDGNTSPEAGIKAFADAYAQWQKLTNQTGGQGTQASPIPLPSGPPSGGPAPNTAVKKGSAANYVAPEDRNTGAGATGPSPFVEQPDAVAREALGDKYNIKYRYSYDKASGQWKGKLKD